MGGRLAQKDAQRFLNETAWFQGNSLILTCLSDSCQHLASQDRGMVIPGVGCPLRVDKRSRVGFAHLGHKNTR